MQINTEKYQIYNQSCYGLEGIEQNSLDALITDPPYGISFQAHYWDKDLPKPEIWENALEKLKTGAFAQTKRTIYLVYPSSFL